MKWVNESHIRHSEKNGTIVLTRRFGIWTVHYGLFEYTSPYLKDMWRRALRTLFTRKEKHLVQKVLMLGLAAGGEIKTLNKFFPNCTLTVVEYDPEMVAIAHELGLNKPFPFPRTLIEDAATAVSKLQGEKFDFIIVDLFSGPTPSELSQNKVFLESLNSILADHGHVLVNIFRENKSYLKAMSDIFTEKRFWTYKQNLLGFFSKRHGSI